MILFEITVQGSGEFPHDMLRYDACWPKSEEDSHELNYSATCRGDMRTVKLRARHDKHWKPTEARWRSHTWDVINVERVP